MVLAETVQAGGPPVLLGASSRWSPRRIVEYCDGWFPVDGLVEGLEELTQGLNAIRGEADRVGRAMDAFDLTVITWVLTAYAQAAPNALQRLHDLIALGFTRIVFLIEPATPEVQWPILEKGAQTHPALSVETEQTTAPHSPRLRSWHVR